MTAVRRRTAPGVQLQRPRAGRKLWLRCWEGLEPAESLPTRDREDLLWDLVHERGWTDREVADHTRLTDYTVCRIRERLGLPANEGCGSEDELSA